jgi:hypothetical protein
MRRWQVVAVLLVAAAATWLVLRPRFPWSWLSGAGGQEHLERSVRELEERLATGPAITIVDPAGLLQEIAVAPGGARLRMPTDGRVQTHGITVFRERNGRPGCQPPDDSPTHMVSAGAESSATVTWPEVADGAHLLEVEVESRDGGSVRRIVGTPPASLPERESEARQPLVDFFDLGLGCEWRSGPGGDLELRLVPRGGGAARVARVELQWRSAPIFTGTPAEIPTGGATATVPRAQLGTAAAHGLRVVATVERAADAAGEAQRLVVDLREPR